MISSLLFALAIQVPPDSTVVRVTMPNRREPVVQVNPTPVSIQLVEDSAAVRRAAQRDSVLLTGLQSCGCATVDTGPPDWFYTGLLALGTYTLYRLNKHWSEEEDRSNEETVIVIEREPSDPEHDHWIPPGHRKKKHE